MLLVRTPPPHSTESLFGYVLRLAEANGYASQNEVLEIAGIAARERGRKVRFDAEKLTSSLGRPAGSLRHLAYAKPGEEIRHALLLGQPVAVKHLRLSRPMLCPQCVADRGFIEAFWDSALIVACPRHRCELLGACPECGRGLGAIRPGLLTCGCGKSLLRDRLPSVSDELADLTDILAAKIVGSKTPTAHASGIPSKELSRMSLWSLHVLITSLGWQQLVSDGLSRKEKIPRLAAPAAKALADWPNNFYALLRNLGKMSAAKMPSTTTFLKRHESINGSLFKKGIPRSEITFIRKAFIHYGLDEWEESIARFRRTDIERFSIEKSFLTRTEIADHLGIGIRTVTKLERENRFGIKRERSGKSSIIVAKKIDVGPPSSPSCRSLGIREAARYLGMPTSVLSYLRSAGIFEIKALATPLAAFHESDLKAFSDRLIKRALSKRKAKNKLPAVRLAANEPVRPLSSIFRHTRFLSVPGASKIITGLLDGQIKAVGLQGERSGGLLIAANEVQPLILECRQAVLGDTHSARESSVFLKTDISTIPFLVESGHLRAVRYPSGMRVTNESLEEFSAGYSSLNSIAKEHGVNSLTLVRICERNGIEFFRIRRTNSKFPQPFIAREHEQRLIRLLKERKAPPRPFKIEVIEPAM